MPAAAPFELHLHPEVLALCGGLLLAYFGAIRRYGPLFHPRPGERSASRGQVACFVSGVAFLWVASGSPLHDIAEQYLFSAHMVQHLIHAFVVPPLLLLGTPAWMAELVLRPRRLGAVLEQCGRPLPAMAMFNTVLILTHWPEIVDLSLRSELFHGFWHVALIATALFMWLAVLSPVPDRIPRLTLPGQMGYLFLQTFVPTVPASFLTFGHAPLYGIYETFPRLLGLSALDDMRLAGLIMKVGGGFFLWTIIAVLFFRWAKSEEDAAQVGVAAAPLPSDLPTERERQ